MKPTHDEHAAAMNTIAALMEILGTSDSLSISGQVAALKADRDTLAGENGQMLRLLTDISENHGEFVDEGDDFLYASVPMDYVSEVNSYVSRDVNAENPFVATDRFIADVKAQGVEEFAEKCRDKVRQSISLAVSDSWCVTWEHANEFAQQLRGEEKA